MSCFKLFIPKDALDEPYRAAPGDLSALPSVPDVLPDSSVERQLKLCASVTPPDDAPLSELITRSSAFPLSFPVNTVRCSHLLNKPDLNEDILQRCANSVYPLLHEKALYLLISFLDFKRVSGSLVERNLYSSLGVLDLVDRLLHKRAASFLGPNDRYQLLTGVKGFSGWEAVGTDNEKEPLILKNCLSYDEMKLSALLSVTSHSVFINNGTRKNKGTETSDIGTFQRHGVIIGIIGARLTRRNIMEAQEIIVRPKQNVSNRGYGTAGEEDVYKWRKIWANFYGIEPNFPLYTEAKKPCRECEAAERYMSINEDELFDNITYQRRLAISFETLLIEAQNRAEKANTTAFVHVVGIGLGVWKAAPHQERQFLNAFGGCVQRLLPVLSRVTDLRFAWFSENSILGVPKSKNIGHIRVDFSKDEPQTKLEKPDQLLVVSYAWDGNALPGNEFWIGWLSSTGDSSTACCSQITELHNPHINPTKVCSKNLHIASPQWGLLHVAQYAQKNLEICRLKRSNMSY